MFVMSGDFFIDFNVFLVAKNKKIPRKMLHFDLLLALYLLGFACALKCYQTDSKTGENVIVDDSDFVYCISFPFVQKGQHKIVGKDKIFTATADGLTKDELDNDYELFFDDSMPEYSLLSICLFEKYDWPVLWKMSPKFSGKKLSIEYQFRCLCNTDLCNGASQIEKYLYKS
uniref:Uncharacterized protein n=1 Tax=Acrobeloides nanus TaxID=290746 RepID=A0A914CRS4_9BILA